MAIYTINSEKLDNIADAINSAAGTSATYTPDEMATAIGELGGSAIISGVDFTTDTLPVKSVNFYGSTEYPLRQYTPNTQGLHDYQTMTDVSLKVWLSNPMITKALYYIKFGDISYNNLTSTFLEFRDASQHTCFTVNISSGYVMLWCSNSSYVITDLTLSDLQNKTLSFRLDYDVSAISNFSGNPFVNSGSSTVTMYLDDEAVASTAYAQPIYLDNANYIPKMIYIKNIDDTLASGTWKPEILGIWSEIKE